VAIDAPTLVTGGTGTLGRAVVRQLRDAGQPVRVLSRRPRSAVASSVAASWAGGEAGGTLDWAVGDLRTGIGVEAALADVPVVIHCATEPRSPGADLAAAGHLIAAARRARPHVVYVSIVGVDRVPLRYYREKLAVEQLVERSGLPWTMLRATQFHDLVLTMLRPLVRLPIVPVPSGTSFQPIDVPEVAAHLIRLAGGLPLGRAGDLGGPQVRSAADLARAYLRSRGRRRRVVPVHLPGPVARGYREGGHLAPDHSGGGRTWEEFLAETKA
jgi:uncharacterized protein YbjT (DUF2867 family)